MTVPIPVFKAAAALLVFAAGPGDYSKGRDLAERYCKKCHGQPHASRPAPGFPDIVTRKDVQSDAWLHRMLRRPDHGMPNYNLSHEEMDHIVRYLRDVARGYPP